MCGHFHCFLEFSCLAKLSMLEVVCIFVHMSVLTGRAPSDLGCMWSVKLHVAEVLEGEPCDLWVLCFLDRLAARVCKPEAELQVGFYLSGVAYGAELAELVVLSSPPTSLVDPTELVVLSSPPTFLWPLEAEACGQGSLQASSSGFASLAESRADAA